MTTKKPRTALAKLLDNLKQTEEDTWPVDVAESVSDADIHESQPQAPAEQGSRVSDVEVVWVDPDKCRPWRFADRPEDEMGDLLQLADSIKQHGQQEPVLLRPLVGHASLEYEVIFGNRRWRACQQAGVKLLGIVKYMTDQQAALCQKEENDQRKDLSDYARARSYKTQLDLGLFTSEAELSKGLNLSRKTLNDIMAYVRIPKELADTIPQFKQLSRALVVKLAVLSKEKTQLAKLIKLGPRIGTQITTSNLERYLQGSSEKAVVRPAPTRVCDAKGKVMFEMLETNQGGMTIKIHKQVMESHHRDSLKQKLLDYFTEQTNQGKPHEITHG